MTKAQTICVRSGSFLPTTAASTTASCSINTDSTSKGPIRYAAEVITSSVRLKNQKYPSSSTEALSPVKYQPALKTPRVASSLSRYSEKSPAGRGSARTDVL